MDNLAYLTWVSLVWLAIITCIFLVWFFSHRARHKERLMMMEKGIDPQSNPYKGKQFTFPWLKIGIIVIGLSVGLAIISLLISIKALEPGGNELPLAILGICGGISMVLANRMDNDKSKS
jgi:hypothetical protein